VQPQPTYQQPAPGQPQPPYRQPAYEAAPGAKPPEKKLSKKLLVLIIIAAAVAAAIVIGILATGNAANQDYFKIGPDRVPSVKLILGEQRDIASFNSSVSGSVRTIDIKYKVDENQNSEMFEYTQALINDYGFVNTNANNFTGPTGSEFIFATESVEEGYIVMVQVDYDTGGYTLTLTRGKGTLTLLDVPEDIIEEDDTDTDEGPIYSGDMTEIIMPAIFNSFVEGEILEQAADLGIEIVWNPDDSLTYIMTAEQQTMLLKDYSDRLVDSFNNIVNDEPVPGLYEIRWSDDFGEIYLFIDDEFFGDEGYGFLVLISLGFRTPIYQVYQGYGDDAITLISIYHYETEELLSSYLCPEEIIELFNE